MTESLEELKKCMDAWTAGKGAEEAQYRLLSSETLPIFRICSYQETTEIILSKAILELYELIKQKA